jgi:TPP-dependent pyruvate/acetoin dehydrogenase alpha subunit
LWPELATTFELDQAWDSALIAGPHADWIRGHDPLLRAARDIVAHEFASPEQLNARDRAARERVAAAVLFAIESPMPAPETAFTGVFA